MLVKFRTPAYGNITMFGDVAVELLKLMGHSGTIPSALNSEDIPEALQRLKKALAERPDAAAIADDDADSSDEFIDQPVSLGSRAFPLIELLEAAAADNDPVLWDEHS